MCDVYTEYSANCGHLRRIPAVLVNPMHMLVAIARRTLARTVCFNTDERNIAFLQWA